jgi:hypothetical protein
VFIRGRRSTSMGVVRGCERIGVQPLVGSCMDVSSTATDTSGSECARGKLHVTDGCWRGTCLKIVSCRDILFVVRGGKIVVMYDGKIFVAFGGKIFVAFGGNIVFCHVEVMRNNGAGNGSHPSSSEGPVI